MMSADNDDGHGGGFSFVAGLFLGTLVGAATAILMAPASGRELRTSLSRGAKKWVAHASELVPAEWVEIAEEEMTKEILENVSNLRAAGL